MKSKRGYLYLVFVSDEYIRDAFRNYPIFKMCLPATSTLHHEQEHFFTLAERTGHLWGACVKALFN